MGVHNVALLQISRQIKAGYSTIGDIQESWPGWLVDWIPPSFLLGWVGTSQVILSAGGGAGGTKIILLAGRAAGVARSVSCHRCG
jgi:hypothetical protein